MSDAEDRRDPTKLYPMIPGSARLQRNIVCTYQNRQHIAKMSVVRMLFSNNLGCSGVAAGEEGVQVGGRFDRPARGFNPLDFHSFPRNSV